MNPSPEDSRREGRAMACDGLMASRFGRRDSHAGAKAIARLRQEQSVVVALPRAVWAPRGTWLAWAAGLVLLLAGSWWFRAGSLAANLASIEGDGSGILIERHGKPWAATAAASLRAGDVITASKGRAVSIRFKSDSTQIILAGSGTLKLTGRRHGKHLELLRGRIEVIAAPQRPGQPLVILTPQAEATVQGTHFYLAAKQTSTWLEVVDGWVDLKRFEDGVMARVGPQKVSVVAPGLEMGPRSSDQRWQTPYCVVKPHRLRNAS